MFCDWSRGRGCLAFIIKKPDSLSDMGNPAFIRVWIWSELSGEPCLVDLFLFVFVAHDESKKDTSNSYNKGVKKTEFHGRLPLGIVGLMLNRLLTAYVFIMIFPEWSSKDFSCC